MGRVLVVDDEPDVLLLCRLNLQQRGSWPGNGTRT
jgi:CheY-like chemotaxis protein